MRSSLQQDRAGFCPVWLRVGLSVAMTAAMLLGGGTVWANATRTFEITWHAYCDEDTSTVCGFADEDALAHEIRTRMRELNEVFRRTGISFRLGELIVVRDDDIAALDRICSDEGDAYHAEMEAIAAEDPTRIHWFGTQRSGNGCSSVPSPNGNGAYAVFGKATSSGNHQAHELAHYFCHPHPFTGQDLADDPPAPNHDGDGIADTPPDPHVFEPYRGDPTGRDEDADGNLVPNHEWCEATQHFDVDPASFQFRYCTVECFSYDGVDTTTTSFSPNTALISSYYKPICSGPYVVDGHPTDAFSPMGRALTFECVATVPQRQSLVDVCGSGNDFDHDGLCDDEDPCPEVYTVDSSLISDIDGDGVGNACDNCVLTSNSDQSDIDQDGAGDACDGDMDNDGCDNDVDQHPQDAQVPVGTVVNIRCPDQHGTDWGFEGADSDGDGVSDCWIGSTDDDGDGVPDDDDPCPTTPGTDETLCATVSGYGTCDLFEAISSCQPICGPELFIRLVSRVNPADHVDYSPVAIAGDVLYLGVPGGMSATQAVRSLDGSNFGPTVSRGNLALELWEVGAREPAQVLVEYATSEVEMTDRLFGRVVAFRLSDERVPSVHSAWGMGTDPNILFDDEDDDGVPDLADNCLVDANPNQADSDGDGYGNLCDPDFDQDGVVSTAEVDFVRSCQGVDAYVEPRYSEEILGVTEPVPSGPEMARAYACRAADLDGDRDVDADDTSRAEALEDTVPGPSGLTRTAGLPPEGEDVGPADDGDNDAGGDSGSDIGSDAGVDVGSDDEPDIGTDGGTDPGADAPAAGPGQLGDDDDDGGCGCAHLHGRGGAAPGLPPLIGVALLGVLLISRRRRRAG